VSIWIAAEKGLVFETEYVNSRDHSAVVLRVRFVW
jgi:hypothetical protein